MTKLTRRAAFLLPIGVPVALMARPIPAASQDRALLELGARFEALLAEQKELDALAEFGGDAESDEAMTAWRRTGEVVDQIRHTEARTVLGLQVKARAALFWSEPEEGHWDSVALSLVKDLIRLPG